MGYTAFVLALEYCGRRQPSGAWRSVRTSRLSRWVRMERESDKQNGYDQFVDADLRVGLAMASSSLTLAEGAGAGGKFAGNGGAFSGWRLFQDAYVIGRSE